MADQAGLDERELRAACRRRRYSRGETIFHEGDPAEAFHMIETGWVAVRLTTELGDETIIDILHAGDTFGEHALIHLGGRRGASVVALERAETLTLDSTGFATLFDAHHPADRFLLIVVSDRLDRTNHQLLDARYLPADRRLLRCLHHLAALFGAGTHDHTIPLTQADVASMTGISRSTANRLLQELVHDDVISIARGRISIVDHAALQQRCGYR